MTDPRTLSEAVPAQTLAKALLEAEEYFEKILWNRPAGDCKNKAIIEVENIARQALAQIQRIKKGEMV